MIEAFLTLCLLHMAGIKDPCWPERAVGSFETDAKCWEAIGRYMDANGKETTGGVGPITISWRCGDAA